MPAWMTPLLCVLVSIPARGWRSRRQTDWHDEESSAAIARPTTPAPTTATSTSVTSRSYLIFRLDWIFRLKAEATRFTRAVSWLPPLGGSDGELLHVDADDFRGEPRVP